VVKDSASASSVAQTDASWVGVAVAGLMLMRGPLAMKPATSNPSAKASAASQPSGFSSGGSRMSHEVAPTARAACAAAVAYSQPGTSLSGHSSTALPASGDQSVLSTGAFAPCIAVVATTPASMSACAHFSPSTRTMVSACAMPGW